MKELSDLKRELKNLRNQLFDATKKHEKLITNLRIRLDIEKKSYYDKYSNVKGFKSRFFRNSKTAKRINDEHKNFIIYKKIIKEEILALIDLIKDKLPKKNEKGTIYEGDLFGFIRGGRSSDVLSLIKRKAEDRSFFSNISIQDTDLAGRTTKEYLQNISYIIEECYKLGSDVFFSATCLAQYEMSDTIFYLALAIKFN